jgi:HAD superfamily hydrolase (TIGR01490 family)
VNAPAPAPAGPDGWPELDPPPRAAFFDVDGTLLAGTTTFFFARLLRSRGLIDQSYLLRMAYHGLQHRFGRLDYGRLLAFGLSSIQGIPVDQLDALAEENFERHVRPRLYRGVAEHGRALKQAGAQIVLLSSSPHFVLAPLGRYLGVDSLITTAMRVVDGFIQGPAGGTPCYGVGKLSNAEAWAAERGIAMDDCVAYADNWSDRALLLRTGRAVVVHPRGRLLRLARKHGWSVVLPARLPRRRPRETPPTPQDAP